MTGDVKRVLVLSHGHPSVSIGGAEVASYNLFRGLGEIPGCDSHYLARVGPPIAPHRDTPFLSLRQKERETLFYANDYDYFRLSNRDLETLGGAFTRFLRDVKPDLVHFHHILGFGVEAIFAVRKTLPDVPIVVTLHEYLAICNHHGQMVKTRRQQLCSKASPADCSMCFPDIAPAQFMRREMFIKSFFDQVDCFVSPSHFLLDRFVDWGIPPRRMRMLENGLDLHEIAPARPLPKRGGRRNRFAYFGQLNEFKGVRVLIDAVGRVPQEVWGDDSVLNIFGGNLELQPEAFQVEIERLIARAGRRVRFHGAYRSAELPTLMREIDWVVVPSTWWENSPIVIQEAFAHGRPLICSDIGGMAEKVRHEVDGLHFRAGSAESLVDRLVEAIRSPDLWERLRAGAPRPLTYRDMAEQHWDLYQSLWRARAGEGATTAAPRAPRAARRAPAGAAVATAETQA